MQNLAAMYPLFLNNHGIIMFLFCGTQCVMIIVSLLFNSHYYAFLQTIETKTTLNSRFKTAHIKLYGVHSLMRTETSSTTLLFEISLTQSVLSYFVFALALLPKRRHDSIG